LADTVPLQEIVSIAEMSETAKSDNVWTQQGTTQTDKDESELHNYAIHDNLDNVLQARSIFFNEFEPFFEPNF
jgi:hypothetical protein